MHIHKEAAQHVKQGLSKSAAEQKFENDGLTRTLLRRYITKCKAEDQNMIMGYGPGGRRIFSDKVEKDLAHSAINLSARFFGLSCVQTRKHAYNFAMLNDISTPSSWHRNEAAELDWLRLLVGRNKLFVRKLEATSLGKASAFNLHNLDLFHNLLEIGCMLVLYFSKSRFSIKV